MRCDELSRKPSFRPGRGSSGQTAPLRALSILCAALLALIPRTGLSADLTNGATGITAAPLVEVDLGHTPKRYGAVGAWGDREVELNDALARDLCSEIRSRGLRCALTRQPWEEISLTGRTQKARRDGASLFISVHHDSVPEMSCARKSGLPGCTTDHASGWSVFVSKKNAQYGKSLEAAAMAGRRLMESGLSFNPTHTGPGERSPFLDRKNGVYGYDNLIVLKTAGMPAFLIETAVITNPADMRKLTGSDYYKRIIAAAADGAEEFLKNGDDARTGGSRRTAVRTHPAAGSGKHRSP